MLPIDKIKNIILGNAFLSNIYWIYRRVQLKFFLRHILMKKYEKETGKILNLNSPKGFNEKIQWIKAYVKNPLMTICADKLRVREYVKNRIQDVYLPRIYGVWTRAEDINIADLPNSFVLKTNHASGEVIIVRNKSSINLDDIKKQVKIWLRRNYYYRSGEWCYKNILPRVYAEELLDIDMIDYKFYCFNGIPKFLYVSQGLAYNHKDAKMCFMSLDWKKTPFQRNDFIQFDDALEKPKNFEKMIDMAKKLSSEFSFCRVDFYDSEKYGVVFSEITFYPASGCGLFYPLEWEYRIGEMLDLSKDKGEI